MAWSVSVQVGGDERAFCAKGEVLKRAMAAAKPFLARGRVLRVGGGTLGMPRFEKREASWGLRVRSSASVCGCRWFGGILSVFDGLSGWKIGVWGVRRAG